MWSFLLRERSLRDMREVRKKILQMTVKLSRKLLSQRTKRAMLSPRKASLRESEVTPDEASAYPNSVRMEVCRALHNSLKKSLDNVHDLLLSEAEVKGIAVDISSIINYVLSRASQAFSTRPKISYSSMLL